MKLAALATELASATNFVALSGRVIAVAPSGLKISGLSPFVQIGDRIRFAGRSGPEFAEVIAFDNSSVLAKPFDTAISVGINARATRCVSLTVAPHSCWKGRVFNALGQSIDGKSPPAEGPSPCRPDQAPPPALSRRRVAEPLTTGVAAIDLFTPLCAGQRIGIFAGSGVGKTTLLSLMSQSEQFDCIVVALVGERGREVREQIEDTAEGNRAKTITVVSTSDESPMMRRLAPRTAVSIAEHFCNRGERVLLVVDSVTRYAHALREIALSAGEPPVARGYPPSVFTDLPRLLERAGPGATEAGSITGVFSVLVDGDDHNDPVADCIRGTLDGHIVLNRSIAEAGRYPAIDLLASLSRLSQHCWTPEQRDLVQRLRLLISRYEDTRDLRTLNAYRAGSDHELDKAVAIVPQLYKLISQHPGDQQAADIYKTASSLLSQ